MKRIGEILSSVVYVYQLLLWTVVWSFTSFFTYIITVQELHKSSWPTWMILIIPVHVFGLWLCFLSRFVRIPKERFCQKLQKHPIIHILFHVIWAAKMYFQYVWAALFSLLAILFLLGEGKRSLSELVIKTLFEFHLLGFIYILLEEHLKQYYNWKMLLYSSAILGSISTLFNGGARK